jgi:hypothetical protein
MSKKGATHEKKHKKKSFKYSSVKFDLVHADIELGQQYAIVEKAFGNGNFLVKNQNGEEITAILRGNFLKGPKNERVSIKSWVLIESVLNKYYINHMYNNIDVLELKKRKEIKDDNPLNSSLLFEEDEPSDDEFDLDDI